MRTRPREGNGSSKRKAGGSKPCPEHPPPGSQSHNVLGKTTNPVPRATAGLPQMAGTFAFTGLFLHKKYILKIIKMNIIQAGYTILYPLLLH